MEPAAPLVAVVAGLAAGVEATRPNDRSAPAPGPDVGRGTRCGSFRTRRADHVRPVAALRDPYATDDRDRALVDADEGGIDAPPRR